MTSPVSKTAENMPESIRVPGDVLEEYGELLAGAITTRHPQENDQASRAEWIAAKRAYGIPVYRRRVIVVEDWVEVTEL